MKRANRSMAAVHFMLMTSQQECGAIFRKKVPFFKQTPSFMKLKHLLLGAFAAFVLSSCSVFKSKYGCPSNGTNVGAEKLLSEPPKKVKKFKA